MARTNTNGIRMTGNRITELADGLTATDAATVGQLTQAITQLDSKQSVRVTATSNITISGPQTIDGVAVVVGDRVLLTAQTDAKNNGLWTVQSAVWSRTLDADGASEFTSGLQAVATEGTANADKPYILTTPDPIVLGTTALTFAPTLGVGGGVAYTNGDGLSLSGATFAVKPKPSGGLLVDGTGVSLDPSYTGFARKFATGVPSLTTATITHSLNTTDVSVTVYEIASGAEVDVDVLHPSASPNTVQLVFAVAPAAGTLRVVVIG